MEDLDTDIEEEEGDGAAWMTTFADLMSLLLTFFVLLLSFAQMDIVKFRDAMGSLQSAFGYAYSSEGLHPATPTSFLQYKYEKKDSFIQDPLNMPYKRRAREKIIEGEKTKEILKEKIIEVKENKLILKRVNEIIKKNNIEDSVEAERTGRGVVVRVKGQLFFPSGSDVLKVGAYPLLDDIIGLAEDFPYRMSVEGHTDDTPINTLRFRSNWELSTARAIAALRYIMDSGRISHDRLGASGYADTRPIAKNRTPEGRQENRRVEFIFFKE
jgi:chemotaxis protein MotB